MYQTKLMFSVLLFLFAFHDVNAQHLEEGQPIEINGMEVSYRIVNERAVTVQREEFDRFEIMFTVKNNTGNCFNIRLTKSPDLSAINSGGLVQFFCSNATGAKMTSKKETIGMRQHNIVVTHKGQQVNAIAGYYFDDGDMRTEKATFIVPKGERPQIEAIALATN